MRNLIIGAVSLIVVLPTLLLAQKSKLVTDLSNRLHVGDSFVPPSSVQLMRGEDTKIDWKALEDKIVLLDLFETSCGTCIQIMPHLQELERKHNDILKVITVTPQDRETMETFFDKNKYLKENQVNLSVIYGDNYLRQLFPYKSVPQAILLYKGKVQAITSSGFIDSDNILRLHREGVIKLPLKDDFGKGDLFTVVNNSKGAIKAGVIFSGYQEGVNYQPWTFELDSLTGLHKKSIYNSSMYGALLSLTAKAKLLDKLFFPRMDRVVWKVKDSTEYVNFDTPEDVWLVDHAVSYERYDQKVRPDSIQARVIMDDFEHLYGLRAYVGRKKIPCLVLMKTDIKPYERKGTAGMVYKGTTALSIFLDYGGKFPPTVDRVKIEDKIVLEPYDTLEQLNQQLTAYGIEGRVEEYEVDVLVIEEVD